MSEEEIIEIKNERRLIRQKKRRKSRIIAFSVLIAFLVIVGVSAYFGVGAAVKTINEKVEEANDNKEQIDEEVETFEELPIVEMTPEIIEEAEEEIEEEIPEEPEQSDEELFDEMIETMISEMSLEDKVAGLFIISPEILTGQGGVTKAGDGTKAALEKYAIGGIVYSKGNIKNAEQLKEMIDNTIGFSKYPLFVGISEESGDGAVLQPALKLDKTASAKELSDAADSNAVTDTYKTIGAYLNENGFNLDFAPCADLTGGKYGESIGSRSFGAGSSESPAMIRASIEGLKETGIVSCAKTFPGQGSASGDPHTAMVEMTRTRSEIEESELIPFKAAIEAGVDMIMVGHFSAPELTGDSMPCSMSKAVMTDLLRNDMGYDGVIITDAMNVPSISEYYGADEVAVKAIKSGADMVMCPENLELAVNAVVEAVKEGTIDERRIDDSLTRVYKIKYKGTLE